MLQNVSFANKNVQIVLIMNILSGNDSNLQKFLTRESGMFSKCKKNCIQYYENYFLV